ncbi:MAG: histidine kinase [Hamadaea sp.]|nr:histidine kinase [Hamadaea sp.]
MRSRRVLLPALVTAWWTSWGLINVVNYGQMYLAGGRPAPWRHLLTTELVSHLLWVPITLGALSLADRFPLGRSGWRGIPAHLGGLAATVVGRAAVVVLLNDHVHWYAESVPPFDELLMISLYNNLFMYALITLAAHALHYARAHRERGEQLERARREALRTQLQPHFLFNALNTIAAVVRSDPEAAERMIAGLGGLLRRSLDSDGRTTVPLGEELATLRAYLEIEQERFADRLAVTWEIDPRVLDAAVPPLLLQPLAENAVRHGLWPRPSGGELRVAARREGGDLVLEISDDGLGLRAEQAGGAGRGIGLGATAQRLRSLYGSRQELRVAARTGGGVVTTVRVPHRVLSAGGDGDARFDSDAGRDGDAGDGDPHGDPHADRRRRAAGPAAAA